MNVVLHYLFNNWVKYNYLISICAVNFIINHTHEVSGNSCEYNSVTYLCISRKGTAVELEDTHAALLSRPEFDLFTNQGLGTIVTESCL